MFGKHTLFLILVLAALIGPAVLYNTNWSAIRDTEYVGYANGSLASIPVRSPSTFSLAPAGAVDSVSTVHVARNNFGTSNPARIDAAPVPAALLGGDVVLPGDANGPDFNAVPLEFMPTADLSEIFRFDVDPSWVRSRWNQVATNRSDEMMSGLRVPLVTGVNPTDLFGSLTYFFDNRQQLQRITFRGWTGDPENLIRFATQNFEMKKQPSNSAGLYLAKSWRKATGALYLQYPNRISTNNPTQKVAVLLEINNPDSRYELSSQVASLIFQ